VSDSLIDIFKVFQFLGLMLVFCIGMTCTLAYIMKFRGFNNRRRLLMNIAELNDEFEDDGTGVEIPPLDPERFLANKNLVKKVKFDSKCQSEFKQTDCSICLEEFKEEENLVMFACKHIFHKKCIEDWVKANIQHSVKCPICNRVLA